MLMRNVYRPFGSILETAFDQVFDDVVSSSRSARGTTFSVESKANEDGSVSYFLDLPGVKEKDLSVEVESNAVSIKAERTTPTSSYSVSKSFSLTKNLDTSSVEAHLEDGVLTINVQPLKSEEKKARKIPVLSKNNS